MHDVRFSVIIPTYNRAELVRATLDSVFAQEFDDYEIIVVDDGSTDGTPDVARSYGERVRVFEQPENRGCAAARNRGAAEASGEYLAFLDSDDFWFPWTLATFDEAIRTHASPAFVAGRLFFFDEVSEIRHVHREPLDLVAAVDLFRGALEHHFFMGVAHGVVRRETYLAVGGCEERNINGTDSDVLLKMGDAPGFAMIRQPATLAYRRHEANTTGNYEKGLAAVEMMLDHEAAGRYPGGPARKRERMANIVGRTRGISVVAALGGRPDLAWMIFAKTFWWNLRLGRVRYLIGLPWIALQSKLRRPAGNSR